MMLPRAARSSSLCSLLPIALATLAACGGKATPAPAPGNVSSRATAVPCPEGDELARVAIAAWGRGPGTATAACGAVVIGGQPLWLINGFLERDESEEFMVGEWTAVVRPSGEVLSVEGDDGLAPATVDHMTDNQWLAADLDGDGDDELINLTGYAHMGLEATSLQVARIRGGVYVPVASQLQLSEDDTASVDADDPDAGPTHRCTATWKLVPVGAAQHLEITYQGVGDCPLTGRAVWKLDGDRLVEVK